MARKENKGGTLKNDQVENDLKVRGKDTESNEAYTGAQDTGDKAVRQAGTDVQRADGNLGEEDNEGK